jgi:superoxide reductase
MSLERSQIYSCADCDALLEVVKGADCELDCCGGTKVELLVEKTADSATEKHVPIIEKVDGGYKVIVGSTLHPMQDDHLIEWIELVVDDAVYRQYLKPGQEPIAEFKAPAGSVVYAREHCNLHGLWKGE